MLSDAWMMAILVQLEKHVNRCEQVAAVGVDPLFTKTLTSGKMSVVTLVKPLPVEIMRVDSGWPGDWHSQVVHVQPKQREKLLKRFPYP